MTDKVSFVALEEELEQAPSGGDSFRPYPEYRDSGIEWLGEVPAHWETWKMCHGFGKTGSGTTPKADETDYYDDGTVAWVTTAELREELIKNTEMRVTDKAFRDHSALKLFPTGTLLVAMYGATIGRVAILAVPACTNQACCALFEPKAFSVRFIFYWLLAFRDPIIQLSSGGGQPNISQEKVRSLKVPVPSLEKQSNITSFLDRQTAKIDVLIERKTRLIDLLNEKRTAVITQAVTKGLNPDVSMGDSGIEWLREVPEHWEIKRTKHVAVLESGHTPSRQHPEYWENCTVPWFTLADVWQLRNDKRDYVSQTKEKVSELGLAHSSARKLPAKTVILSRTASVGFAGIMQVSMATTQDFVNWICGPEIIPEYLLYVFRSMRQEFTRLLMGSTHKTIYMPEVGTFVTPVPPVDDQKEIVAFIRGECRKLDALSEKIEAHIEKLQEYRSALITATVTGKIDVREAA